MTARSMRHHYVLVATSLAGLVFGAREASAQDKDEGPEAPPTVAQDAGGAQQKGNTEATQKPDEGARVDGWSPGIALGALLNLVDTRSVVGQQDGTTFTFGAAIDASLEFNEGMHEWRNNLALSAGTTRTPAIDEFIKTNDGLYFESIYLLHVLEMFGPFARFGLNTQMFPSTDIRPAAVDYVVSNLDGTTSNFTGRRLAMTDAFQPLTLKESIGVFVQPIRRDEIELEARAGLGAQETFAEGGLAIDDDDATAGVEVKELDDFYLIGAEAVVNAWGFMDPDKRISYTVGAGVLIPFVTSDLPEDDDRSLPELTTVEGMVGINVKLFDWASLGYKLTVMRQPMLVDEWQVSNNLLLTIGAAFGSKAPKEEEKCPPPPPPAEEEAKDAATETTAPAGETTPAPAPAPATPTPAPAPDPEPPPPPPAAPAPANP